MRRFKTIILTLALSMLSIGGFGLAPAAALSVYGDFGTANYLQQDACDGLNQVNGSTDSGCSGLSTQGSGINTLVSNIVDILSWVVGIIAVIVIIVSGLRYITSGGDSNAVGNAKRSLIYALIGVVIAALAQVLVHFVLNRASTGS